MADVKLRDIADLLGVSNVTVSNALAGRKGVGAELRARICEEAARLGYMKDRTRRKRAETGVDIAWGKRIAVLMCDTAKFASFGWSLYENTVSCASQRGCVVMLEQYTREMEKRLTLPQLVTEYQVDGIIMIGRARREYVKRIAGSADVPVVMLGHDTEDLGYDCVVPNVFHGMHTMTNYLFRMGHTRIAYVGNIMAAGSIMDGYRGYCKSLIDHGVPERADWVISDRDDETGAVRIADLPEDMPTAFVCISDLTADVLADELRRAGYRVPEDVSIVGCGDHISDPPRDPVFTTYEVNRHEMADRAVEILLKRIAGDTETPRRAYTVAGRMVVWKSVQKLKNR